MLASLAAYNIIFSHFDRGFLRENLPKNYKQLRKKKEKEERKRRKRKKGEKEERKEDFLWNRMALSTSRHAERVAPKAPRGAKNLCRFGLEVQHLTSMIYYVPDFYFISRNNFRKLLLLNERHFLIC